MTIAASTSVGRATALERDLVMVPARWRADASRRGVILCHGHGDTASSFNDAAKTGQRAMARALAAQRPLVAGHFGGDQWGNDASLAKVLSHKTFMQLATSVGFSKVGAAAGKVHLLGVSMGATTALAYAKANPTHVASVVAIIPVLDLAAVDAGGGALGASLDTAYGGGGYVEATHGATKNPATIAAAGGFDALPILLFASSDDATPGCTPGVVTAFDAAADLTTVVNLGALGHTEAAVAAASTATILDFLTAND